MAEGGLLGCARQVIGDAGHVFEAAGYLGFCLAELDFLGREGDGFEAGGTDFVDGCGFDGGGEAGEDGGLTGGGLAYACCEDVAHVDVGDFGDWDGGFGDGGFDGGGTEVGCWDGGEAAVELNGSTLVD